MSLNPLIQSGVYVLWIYLPKSVEITIGKLGKRHFPQGVYAYCGSAQNNLTHRIKRHCRSDKKLRWHIDYFLLHARVIGVLVLEMEKEGECWLTQQVLHIPGAQFLVKGFGSSDCKCISHLVYTLY